jgi:carboxylesterase
LAILRGAEPFFMPGGRQGVLLVHGFTGSPSEMRLMGEFLQQQGFTVLGPRLCGHGTSAAEMADTAWPHWYSAVEDGYHLLKAVCDDIAVVGLSLGGLLSFKLAGEYPVRGIVSLNTPIYIADRRLPFLPVVRMFRNFMPKRRRKTTAVDSCYSISYDKTPLNSLSSLLELIKEVDGLLPQIGTPTLIVQSRNEHTIRPESASYIYDRLGGEDKKLVWLERSGHVVTLDVEHQLLFETVAGFLAIG